MKILAASFMVVIFPACTNHSGQEEKKDTAVVYPTDSNVPLDTDDHNKNIFDTVPLDAPPSTVPRDSSSQE